MKSIFATSVKKLDTSLLAANVLAQPYLSATLTSDNTNVADGDTVVIGIITYTFKTSISNLVAYQVHIGTDADGSLNNLRAAQVAGAGGGTDYSTPTTAHPFITPGPLVAHAFAITGHDYQTLSETSAHLSWSSTSLVGTAAMERAMDGAVSAVSGGLARQANLVTDITLLAVAGSGVPLSAFNTVVKNSGGTQISSVVLSNPNGLAAFDRALEAALTAAGPGSTGVTQTWIVDVDLDNS